MNEETDYTALKLAIIEILKEKETKYDVVDLCLDKRLRQYVGLYTDLWFHQIIASEVYQLEDEGIIKLIKADSIRWYELTEFAMDFYKQLKDIYGNAKEI